MTVGGMFKQFVDLTGMQTIVKNIRTDNAKPQMADSGPYEVSRNPCYLGQTLIALGGAVISPSLDRLLSLGAHAWLTEATVRTEETRNELRFGDNYKKYRKRVPRWISFNNFKKLANQINI
jgi:protein-S-isoprenylcysteine O-methyltransferase Ste14